MEKLTTPLRMARSAGGHTCPRHALAFAAQTALSVVPPTVRSRNRASPCPPPPDLAQTPLPPLFPVISLRSSHFHTHPPEPLSIILSNLSQITTPLSSTCPSFFLLPSLLLLRTPHSSRYRFRYHTTSCIPQPTRYQLPSLPSHRTTLTPTFSTRHWPSPSPVHPRAFTRILFHGGARGVLSQVQ